MEHSWSVLCHRVIIDKDTFRLTLLDTIEQLKVTGPKQELSQELVLVRLDCVLASHWTRSDLAQPETSQVRISLVNPHGEMAPFTEPSPLV